MKIFSPFCRLKSVFIQCAIVFILLECLIVNSIILFFIWHAGGAILAIANAPGGSLLDKLAASPTFRELVRHGKEGGFVSILQHTLDRVYIEQINDSRVLGKLGVDVSGAGETLYIYRRLQKWESSKKWTRLVVDIGANDGFLSSNSHNFIRWGWKAILVEPQATQLQLAKENLKGLAASRVLFVQGVLDEHDGYVNFQLSTDMVSMESHVVSEESPGDGGTVMRVKCYSVKTFAALYNVSKHFGILSIDAESSSSRILHQWINLGYRPLFIIYESLHSSEDFNDTANRLDKAGYKYLTKKGWNHIFELRHMST